MRIFIVYMDILSPSFDDGMMEIQLQKRLQIFLLNKICQSKTHGQTVSYALYYL